MSLIICPRPSLLAASQKKPSASEFCPLLPQGYRLNWPNFAILRMVVKLCLSYRDRNYIPIDVMTSFDVVELFLARGNGANERWSLSSKGDWLDQPAEANYWLTLYIGVRLYHKTRVEIEILTCQTLHPWTPSLLKYTANGCHLTPTPLAKIISALIFTYRRSFTLLFLEHYLS